MSKKIFFLSFCLLVSSCTLFQVKPAKREYMEAATVWVQTAAEVKALCLQAYNAATLSLDAQLRKRRGKGKKPAVVLDADETVVDNSPYQATGVLEGRDYSPETWGEWVEMAKAEAIPGAVEFLKHAHKKGVEIFLITNREIKHFEATYKNLVALGIPIKRENLLLKTETSSKTARRAKVLKDHDVLIYAGDVLPDFATDFEHKNLANRDALVEKYRKKFGTHFIVLPNPMYGEWEAALYHYDFSISDQAKARLRRARLKPMQ